jgi:hypothetical protein
MPIMAEKPLKHHCFKNMKYYTNKAWMTTFIFTEFLSVLDVATGVQGRKTLFTVGNCAAHPQDMSFLWNLKSVY